MKTDTGDSEPKRQPAHRTPFAARQEIARLRSMQDQGVVHPSSSPWASPMVLVRKQDGYLRFCKNLLVFEFSKFAIPSLLIDCQAGRRKSTSF